MADVAAMRRGVAHEVAHARDAAGSFRDVPFNRNPTTVPVIGDGHGTSNNNEVRRISKRRERLRFVTRLRKGLSQATRRDSRPTFSETEERVPSCQEPHRLGSPEGWFVQWETLFRRAVGHPEVADVLDAHCFHQRQRCAAQGIGKIQADCYQLCRTLDKHGLPVPDGVAELIEVRRVNTRILAACRVGVRKIRGVIVASYRA